MGAWRIFTSNICTLMLMASYMMASYMMASYMMASYMVASYMMASYMVASYMMASYKTHEFLIVLKRPLCSNLFVSRRIHTKSEIFWDI
jgi:hypothetical protein